MITMLLSMGLTLQAAGCGECHDVGSAPRRGECAGCHLETRGRELPYRARHPLGALERFDGEGLRRFLTQPVPRRPRSGQSMYPVDDRTARALTAGLPTSTPDLGLAASGRALYQSLGCEGCHDGRVAPLLRIGYPLLSEAYVVRTLQKPLAAAMPSFAQLPASELKSLYAYLSTSDEDLARIGPASPPVREPNGLLFGSKLYAVVKREIVEGSCRHCHAADESQRAQIGAAFGLGSMSARLTIERHGKALRFAPSSSPVLATGAGCSDSLLVERLEERRHEWAGNDRPTARGMPLTLEHLSPPTIDAVRTWTRTGCWTPDGPLCKPCRG